MKKYFFIVGLGLMLSCQQKKNGPFVVSGQILNGAEGKIVLQELPYNGENPVVVDSSTLKSKGTFELRALGKEENLYRILLQDGTAVYFVNDNNRIRIKMNATDFRNPEFENSEASASLYDFIRKYLVRDSSIRVLYNTIQEKYNTNPGDSSIKQMDAQGQQQIKELNSFTKEFVTSSKSPAVAYFAIAKSVEFMQPNDVKSLTDIAAAKFKEHTGLAILKSKLTVAAAQAPATPDYPLLNQQAPELTMNDINGKPVSVSSFKGKYVLVDFWASWCKPCREENPTVVKAYNDFKDKNFTILGVSLDQDKKAWMDAIKQDNLTWTQMSDLKFWESSAVNTYQFSSIPFNVLIDPNGKIIASGLRGTALENKLRAILK